MRRLELAVLLATAGAIAAAPPAAHVAESKRTIETLVFVRHGEKPREGLGLLTCYGLNRALKLPAFDGQRYDYVRPLLTIGSTAIRPGVPVNKAPKTRPCRLVKPCTSPKRSVAVTANRMKGISGFMRRG